MHRPRLRRAVYDTSALMLLAEGIHVFDDVEALLEARPECIVLRPILEELKKHSQSRSVRKRRAARLALSIIERRCHLVEFGSGMLADDAIVEYVLRDQEAIPVTADTGLHRRLLRLGIPHIYYREEKRGFELSGRVV